jgi:hypothetical protein
MMFRNLSSVTLFALSSFSLVQSTLLTEDRLTAFSEWVEAHEKEYETVDERHRRLMTWAENDGTCVFLDDLYK